MCKKMHKVEGEGTVLLRELSAHANHRYIRYDKVTTC